MTFLFIFGQVGHLLFVLLFEFVSVNLHHSGAISRDSFKHTLDTINILNYKKFVTLF